MRKTIDLTDTTFRAYRKKSGAVILHLRSYLIVRADAVLRTKLEESRPTMSMILSGRRKPEGLSVLLTKFPCCWIRLPGKKECECDVSYSAWPVSRRAKKTGAILEHVDDNDCMLYHFFVSVIIGDSNIDDCVADMRLVLHVHYPNRAPQEQIIRRKVPVLTRFIIRLGRRG